MFVFYINYTTIKFLQKEEKTNKNLPTDIFTDWDSRTREALLFNRWTWKIQESETKTGQSILGQESRYPHKDHKRCFWNAFCRRTGRRNYCYCKSLDTTSFPLIKTSLTWQDIHAYVCRALPISNYIKFSEPEFWFVHFKGFKKNYFQAQVSTVPKPSKGISVSKKSLRLWDCICV